MTNSPSQKCKGPPMSLANMRENGVHAVIATCQACGHKADVNVDELPASTAVPHVGQRLRCSQCGGKKIETRPARHTVSGLAWEGDASSGFCRMGLCDLAAARPPFVQ